MKASRYLLGLMFAILFVCGTSWAGGRVDQGGSGKGSFDSGSCDPVSGPPCLSVVPVTSSTAGFYSNGVLLYNLYSFDIPGSGSLTVTLNTSGTWGTWICGGIGFSGTSYCTNIPDCTTGACSVFGSDSTVGTGFLTGEPSVNGNQVTFNFDLTALQDNGITSWTFYDQPGGNTSAPEPATVLLLGAGLIAAGAARRRLAN